MPEKLGPDPIGGLQRLRVFANLTAIELHSLAPLLQQQYCRRGEFVFHMGENAQRLYVLEKGAIKISRMSPTGDERFLQLHKPGDMFGWLYMCRLEHWTVAAQALSNSTVRTIARQAFMRCMQAIPALSLNFIDNLIEQLRRMLVRVEALEHPEPGPRLMTILVDLAEQIGECAGDSYTLPGFPTQGDLARMVGLNRSTVNLLINEYRRKGILGGQRGVLVVHRAPTRALLRRAGLIVG